jgi:hypothetical protein
MDYWDQRVGENGHYENVYTVGMRGIRDSGMPGRTRDEKRDQLEKIIGLSEMLARHVNADASRLLQIFVPYEEVLDIYQSSLKLPDDITVVWPDDNFVTSGSFRTRASASGLAGMASTITSRIGDVRTTISGSNPPRRRWSGKR